MCLAVPGKIVSIEPAAGPDSELAAIGRQGTVSFGGALKQVCLAYTPEAEVGDYVVVHVGFALHTIDEAEAQRVFLYLEEIDALAELGQEDAIG